MAMIQSVEYLLSLPAIRNRANIVYDAALRGQLLHFDLYVDRLDNAADFVASLIVRDFGPDNFDQIPPHGRWQHFNVGGVPRVETLLKEWEENGCDKKEIARRLIDLFLVSVLLDAGAGDHWTFTEPGSGFCSGRSEGLAVASLYMFKSGLLSSMSNQRFQVDGHALQDLQPSTVADQMQSSVNNPLIGVEGRTSVLRSLGSSLLGLPEIFGNEGRPGNIVDYLLGHTQNASELDVRQLWSVLQKLLIPIWPSNRTQVEGVPIGDAWPSMVLRNFSKPETSSWSDIQPFHKLTQWLTYSLMVPFERILGTSWTNADLLTGLPEYRNGGLFVDAGVLQLKRSVLDAAQKDPKSGLPVFDATSDVIVEWRAMTVALLDTIYKLILEKLKAQTGNDILDLSMAQILESGTWKAGRELAAKARPDSKSSPIIIISDGTLF